MNAPLWIPSQERIENAQITEFQTWLNNRHSTSLTDYPSLYQWSIDNPAEFWQGVWDFCGVISSQAATSIVDNIDAFPGANWFPGSRLNFAENLLQRRDDTLAIIGRLENGERRTLTYKALYEQVEQLAGALRQQGVVSGDRVAGFMPNVPETIIAMLATTSIGAIWSSCSPDFGINGVMDRFGQIEPKVLFACNGYYYNGKTIDSLPRVEEIAASIGSIETLVLVPTVSVDTATTDISHIPKACWFNDYLVSTNTPALHFEQLPFDHPVYIMYSSGTTGVPKCIVHGAGGALLQHLKEHRLHVDVKAQERLFYFTTCGWMMWNWLVSGLASGATLVLFDGSPFYPDAKALIDMAEEEDIAIFGTSAKYIAALEKNAVTPKTSHQLPHLKALLSTGSPLSHESFRYVYRDIKDDVCLSSISGGTDIISCFALGCTTLPVYEGELQCRGLGMAVNVWDDDGQPMATGKGELVCTRSFPVCPIYFWNDTNNEKFHSAYFDDYPNVWAHGDYAEITEHNGVIIHGRSDAVLNPGGVRIGTAEIYRQVEKVSQVIDSICIGQQWDDDVRVVLFVVLREGIVLDETLTTTIKKTIRAETTPRHVPAKVIQVSDIPRTISGKIVELAVRNIVHGKPVKNQDALANPEALALFENLPELNE